MAEKVTKTAEGVVVLDFNDLMKEPPADLSASIEAAFGSNCLGALFVKNIPNFPALRYKLLSQANAFSKLPESTRAKYEHPESKYNFGWSHGKEIMNGKPDYSKGSFYANPLQESSTSSSEASAYAWPNIWPTGEDCPGFKEDFTALGQLVYQVGMLVAKQCDKYVSQVKSGISKDHVLNLMKPTNTAKARLLHYFPVTSSTFAETLENMDSWCGWHLDHSALTGLTRAMYVKESDPSPATPEEVLDISDKEAGLYIRSRTGEVTKVDIPENYLAFQLGEALQVATEGRLAATPHCVRASRRPELARNTFAVFMQPESHQLLKDGFTFGEFTEEVLRRHYQ